MKPDPRTWLTSHARAPAFAFDEEALPGGGQLVSAAGELDVAAAGALRLRLRNALDSGVTRLVLDLTDVDFIDSMSVAAIVGTHRRLGPRGHLVVVSTHPYVQLIFEAAGVIGVIDLVADRTTALERLGG
jgi:anti-sigma B factor antagonist